MAHSIMYAKAGTKLRIARGVARTIGDATLILLESRLHHVLCLTVRPRNSTMVGCQIYLIIVTSCTARYARRHPSSPKTSICVLPVHQLKTKGSLEAALPTPSPATLEFLELKDKLPLVDLSRLFIYYDERVVEHTVNSDSGAMLRDGIKTLAKQGVCTEKTWPYIISEVHSETEPNELQRGTAAPDHIISSYPHN